MCEHEMLRDAKDNVIVVGMRTIPKTDAYIDEVAFPARICSKCRSVFVPTTVSQSFELMGTPEGHLTR